PRKYLATRSAATGASGKRNGASSCDIDPAIIFEERDIKIDRRGAEGTVGSGAGRPRSRQHRESGSVERASSTDSRLAAATRSAGDDLDRGVAVAYFPGLDAPE